MTIYLYIKEHNVTGLKYFGKTIRKDPYKYSGSGVYWQAHLKKHGYDFNTKIIAMFDDQEMATEFAVNFSIDNDIVKSKLWANLVEENAASGGSKGRIVSDETRRKISENSKSSSDETRLKISIATKGRILSEEHKEKLRGKSPSEESRLKMSKAGLGRIVSEETRKKISESKTGKSRPPDTDETRAKKSESRRGKKRGPYKRK